MFYFQVIFTLFLQEQYEVHLAYYILTQQVHEQLFLTLGGSISFLLCIWYFIWSSLRCPIIKRWVNENEFGGKQAINSKETKSKHEPYEHNTSKVFAVMSKIDSGSTVRVFFFFWLQQQWP